MPFQFPDPSVSTTATLPNGELWEYVNGAWRAVPTQDDDQAQIDALVAEDIKQDVEIAALKSGESVDRHIVTTLSSRVSTNEDDIAALQNLDVQSAISLLQTARQDIIELQSKVNTLELTNFLILE